MVRCDILHSADAEICGDGRNFHTYECDDGNTKGGDGCSANCRVESYFECTGGNDTTADTCVNRKPPTMVVFRYFANRSATVSFSGPVSLVGTQLESLIELSISSGAGVSWSYSTFKPAKFRSLTFSLSYNQSLSGGELLTLTMRDPGKIADLHGNLMQVNSISTKVTKYKYISLGEKTSAEGAGDASVYTMLPSLALSMGISFVLYYVLTYWWGSNTPIEGMWMAMSVIQMISYVTLIDLNYPANLLYFLEKLESVHNFNKWLPNPFEYVLAPSRLNMTVYNEQFGSRGFTNCQMILLCGADLIVILGMLLAVIVLKPLSSVFAFLETTLKKMRYSSITRSFIQSYLKFCLACFVQIKVVSSPVSTAHIVRVQQPDRRDLVADSDRGQLCAGGDPAADLRILVPKLRASDAGQGVQNDPRLLHLGLPREKERAEPDVLPDLPVPPARLCRYCCGAIRLPVCSAGGNIRLHDRRMATGWITRQ